LLAVLSLGQPCALVRDSDGRIQLLPAQDASLVLHTGMATWGAWCAGDGAALYTGAVTDENGMQGAAGALVDSGGVGPWVLAGTPGTQLYAGGIVALHTALIG